MPAKDLCALHAAPAHLAGENAAAVPLVDLRLFAGFSHQEAAEVKGIVRQQADRLWGYARTRLLEAVGMRLSAEEASRTPG